MSSAVTRLEDRPTGRLGPTTDGGAVAGEEFFEPHHDAYTATLSVMHSGLAQALIDESIVDVTTPR